MHTPAPATRPRTFLMCPLGYLLAHVGRLSAIGKALRARGHRVIFAGDDPANPRSRMHFAQAEGFECVPAREPNYPYAWDRFVKHGWVLTAFDLMRVRRWAPLDAILERQLELIDDLRPDMIIGDASVTVSTAAHIAGLPAAGVMNGYATAFVRNTSVFKPIIHAYNAGWLAPIRNTVYRKRGKTPVNALRLLQNMPLISPDLPDLYSIPKKWSNWHFVGPIVSEPPVGLPDWFDELEDGTPNIYITMGSTGRLDEFLLRTYDALGQCPYRFIVTTGGQVSEQTQAQAPANFRFTTYAPGSQLMARCEALIFHGGNGTMYQGLAAGVPMIALPSHLEQGLNAKMAVRRGFCLMFSPRRVRGPQIVQALERILHEPKYREAARTLQPSVRAAHGAEAAADLIERWAEEARPLSL